MSLIRCLGPVRLPASYRNYLAREADIYRRKRLYDPGQPNEWVQDFILPKSYEGNGKTHILRGRQFPISIPAKCENLTKSLQRWYKGNQNHTAMTLVSTQMHQDHFSDQNATVLFIPHRASTCHYLHVEDEKLQIKPNHIYAFSQFRLHALVYEGPKPEDSGSTPCSALFVSFNKL
jgi:hypothetical protein